MSLPSFKERGHLKKVTALIYNSKNKFPNFGWEEMYFSPPFFQFFWLCFCQLMVWLNDSCAPDGCPPSPPAWVDRPRAVAALARKLQAAQEAAKAKILSLKREAEKAKRWVYLIFFLFGLFIWSLFFYLVYLISLSLELLVNRTVTDASYLFECLNFCWLWIRLT